MPRDFSGNTMSLIYNFPAEQQPTGDDNAPGSSVTDLWPTKGGFNITSRQKPLNPIAPSAKEQQRVRWAYEHRRLHEAATSVIRCQPALVNIGSDPIIEALALERQIKKHSIVAMRLLYGARSFTAVFVGRSVWKSRELRRRILDMKFSARLMGIKIILLPGSAVQRSNRRHSAQVLGKSRAVHPSHSERRKILQHVLSGESTVQRCARLIAGHSNAVGIVLNLCATGWLKIDRSERLSPNSRVSYRGNVLS